MDIKINLLKLKYAKRRIWLGIGAFLYVAIWLVIEGGKEEGINSFDIAILSYFFIIGVIHLYESRGVSANQLIGRSYLHLTDEWIAYKPKFYKAEKRLYWKELDYILDKANRLYLVEKSGDKINLDMSAYAYDVVQEVRAAIANLSENKGIIIKRFERNK